MPDAEPRPGRGHEAWTVAGEERRLTPEQLEAFNVSEADAEAFIALEIQDVLTRHMPVFEDIFRAMASQLDPGEHVALMAGIEQTLSAIATGDQAAIERFRERSVRVAAAFEARGRTELADVVRRLPDTLIELLGRP